MRRPTFFLSSTIYDFKDLRSAIKFYLEEQGCTVMASEFNDFMKPLDIHSYEACLNGIRKADFFILLIGNRVGGWYEELNRVSITQREYREALTLHKQGKLKLINFVRSDIWRHKEDRKELIKYLDTLNLLNIDAKAKHQIVNYPSKFATDADFILNFITEVSQNRETISALKRGTDLPTGNWIHVFDSFKDIVDVLRTQIFAGIPLEEAIQKQLLQRELTEFLRLSLVKFNTSSVHSPRQAVEEFYKSHEITLDSRNLKYTNVEAKLWDLICGYLIHLLGMRLHPLILPKALASAAFLRYDLDSGAYKEEPVYEALYLLQEEIRLLTLANTSDTLSIVFQHTPRVRAPGQAVLKIETIKLLPLLHLLDRWINIIELALAIVRHLNGKPFIMPSLRTKSPIKDMDIRLANETVTMDDIQQFMRSSSK